MAEDIALAGWGRAIWSRCRVEHPDDVDEARRVALEPSPRGVIARGLGRSYGDQATNAGGTVVDLSDIAWTDAPVPADGVITVPGGASLDDIIRSVVPQGWFVPVSPGTRFVTVGGAIAADVHGKNHHVHGTIAEHLEWLDLLLADGSVVRCSAAERPELFWATAGGLGLTGIVLQARMRLKPIGSSRLAVDTSRINDLDALLAAMVEADHTATYSVAWIDLMARGAGMGRSVLTVGDFAPADAVPGDDRLGYSAKSLVSAPPWVPDGLLRPLTIRAFNEAWFRLAPTSRTGELQSIPRFFHPLDGVRAWNRMYGSRGFLQWQVVVPDGSEDVLRRTVEDLSASGAPSFLAVLKRFGAANPGPLSFPFAGWTLAADFPVAPGDLAVVLDRLDEVAVEAGGRIYLAKDARLRPEILPAMYPRLDEWREIRESVDPQRHWQSDLARRLGL